jgi:hypothetical protein
MSDRLIDLYRAVSWKPVEDILRTLDPEDTEGIPELFIHREVFQKMCRMDPPLREEWLIFEVREEQPDENGERKSYVDVCCTDGSFDEDLGGEIRLALDYRPWAECLGMRVPDVLRAHYTDEEIVAHSLWEMTFYGTEEEEIQEQGRVLIERVERRLSEDAVPIEQIFANLGLENEPERRARENEPARHASPAFEDGAPRPATDEGFRVTVHPSAVSEVAMLAWNPDAFVQSYAIPGSNLRNWEINPRNLALSTSALDGPPLERISWHPLSGEMILSGHAESHHAMDIHNHGSHPFVEYVRALVLPEKRMVATRPWCPLEHEAARHLDEDSALRLSHGGQRALETVLRKAGLPKSWRFVVDIDNARLEQLTGRRGW